MKKNVLWLSAGCTALLLAAWVGPAGAQSSRDRAPTGSGAAETVFVQTDNTSGNKVVAYARAGNGTLTLARTYVTGGRGGVLNGSVVDHLASQGSLTYDPVHALLYAVNAGSNTLTVFSVTGDTLQRRQTIGSGGTFPVSVAVDGDIVYVLNALGGGSVAGFRVKDGQLDAVSEWTRALNLTIPNGDTQYGETPGQVTFSPGASQLIVTTKLNGSDLDVFSVGPHGELSPSPVVNAETGTGSFAAVFDATGHLIVSDVGTAALSTYTLNTNGTLTSIDTLGTGQIKTCWVTAADGYFYASNPGSASVSTFTVNSGGQLSLDGRTPTDPGTVDSAATANGRYLYIQTGGNGIVDEFSVGAGGVLTEVGSVMVAGSIGGEGIVAF